MEPQNTTGEKNVNDDIILDDIVIEDIGDGPETTPTFEAVEERSEPEVIPLDVVEILDEKPLKFTVSENEQEDPFVDLNALTAEVDSLDRVLHEVPGNRGDDPLPPFQNDDSLSLDNIGIDDVQELNLDDLVWEEARSKITPGPETEKGKNEEKTEEKSEAPIGDVPYDLIDDEFIILEEEYGEAETPLSAKSAGAAPDSHEGPEEKRELVIEEKEIVPALNGELHPGPGRLDAAYEMAPVQKTGDLTIQIPDGVKKNLNFRISDLRPIDLIEAEKIADEDILLLKEEDLVEELDSMDLVYIDEEPVGGESDSFEAVEIKLDEEETISREVTELAELAPAAPTAVEESELFREDDFLGVAAEEVAVVDEEAQVHRTDVSRGIVDEEIVNLPPVETAREGATESIILEYPNEEEAVLPEELPVSKAEIVDRQSVQFEDVLEGAIQEEGPHKSRTIEEEMAEPIILEDVNPEETAGTIVLSDEGTETGAESAGSGERQWTSTLEEGANKLQTDEPLPKRDVSPGPGTSAETEETPLYTKEPGPPEVKAHPLLRESIPEELQVASGESRVFVIDDIGVEKEFEKSPTIFEENDLEKITASMVEVVEGESKFLREASAEEDHEQMAAIMGGTAMAFEDLLIDFEEEYKFLDEETGFIDSSFIPEAYHEHMDGVEETLRKKGKVTRSLELFGLTDGEISDIELGVFTKEYAGIDLAKAAEDAGMGLDQAPGDFGPLGDFRYLGGSAERMNRSEKRSVEEDLASGFAVIFEENADDIRRLLANYRKSRKTPASMVDISDDIILLDDGADVERFAGTMAVEKRKNIQALLKYLDGLFEKLPEDVIRKFAESEYFNLYVQVLNELER